MENSTIDFEEKITVNAPAEKVFEGLVYRFGEGNTGPNDMPMPMKIELFPGGRWYRDLGDDSGHIWGHVQSIKAPNLLEFYGQLFMSYPVSNHVIIRLSETEDGTEISFRHRALGLIEEDHRDGLSEGWKRMLDSVKEHCEQ